MRHLDEGLLHALLDGEIPSTELPPIQAHLAGCAGCRARLEEERAMLEESDVLIERLQVPEASPRREAAPGRQPAPLPWRTLAWAASVVLAVGLGYVARGEPKLPTRPMTGPPATVTATAPPNPAPGALPEPAASTEAAAAGKVSRVPAPGSMNQLARAQSAQREPEAKSAAERHDTGGRLGASADVASVAPAETTGKKLAAEVPPAAPPVAREKVQSAATPSLRLDEVVVTGANAPRPAFGRLVAPAPTDASLNDALTRLGGTLRLIEGLVPRRLELQGDTVRVVYAVTGGQVVLVQWLANGRVLWTLRGDAGVSPDTLARLRDRVRE